VAEKKMMTVKKQIRTAEAKLVASRGRPIALQARYAMSLSDFSSATARCLLLMVQEGGMSFASGFQRAMDRKIKFYMPPAYARA